MVQNNKLGFAFKKSSEKYAWDKMGLVLHTLISST